MQKLHHPPFQNLRSKLLSSPKTGLNGIIHTLHHQQIHVDSSCKLLTGQGLHHALNLLIQAKYQVVGFSDKIPRSPTHPSLTHSLIESLTDWTSHSLGHPGRADGAAVLHPRLGGPRCQPVPRWLPGFHPGREAGGAHQRRAHHRPLQVMFLLSPLVFLEAIDNFHSILKIKVNNSIWRVFREIRRTLEKRKITGKQSGWLKQSLLFSSWNNGSLDWLFVHQCHLLSGKCL